MKSYSASDSVEEAVFLNRQQCVYLEKSILEKWNAGETCWLVVVGKNEWRSQKETFSPDLNCCIDALRHTLEEGFAESGALECRFLDVSLLSLLFSRCNENEVFAYCRQLSDEYNIHIYGAFLKERAIAPALYHAIYVALGEATSVGEVRTLRVGVSFQQNYLIDVVSRDRGEAKEMLLLEAVDQAILAYHALDDSLGSPERVQRLVTGTNEKRLTLPASQGESCVFCAGHTINKAVLVEEGGAYYAVNPNAILTINCIAACNARCFFCYNRRTFMRCGTYVSTDHPCLTRAIRFARAAGIRRVGLSGGEPTLCPEGLLALAEKLRNAHFDEIRLHTNALLLSEKLSYAGTEAPLHMHLRVAGITDVSISVADYRPERNKAIMGIDNSSMLCVLIPALIDSGLRVRFSCFLCPDGIYDADEAEDYLRWGLLLGVKQFIFRVSPEGGGPALLEIIEKRLMKRGYTLNYYHHKSDSIIYEMENPEIHISLSCAGEEPDPDPKIRRLIYMPDNVLYTSWIDPSSYLFDDDAERLVRNALSTSKSPESELSTAAEIDLHVHSLVSDGLLPPTEVLRRAAEVGIRELVFTEHNCLHSSPLLLRMEAEKMGLKLPLFGIEFSTIYTYKSEPQLKFHVLVYAESPEQLDFRYGLYDPNRPRNEHIRALYEVVRTAGVVDRSLDEIYAVNDPSAPTRKFMLTRSLLAQEIAERCGCTEAEARETWLPQIPDAERYKYYIDCRELLSLAHESGCAVVLAHPGWIRPYRSEKPVDEQTLFRSIAELTRFGLDGIEVYHRLNSADMRGKLLCLASALNLLVTGGSDFHGKPRCVFGENGVTERQLELLVDRVRNRRATV